MKSAPDRLRLVPAPSSTQRPKPPFGMAAFDDEAPHLAIEARAEDSIEALVARVPEASDQPANTVVVVLGGASRGLLAKMFGKSQPVDRALRCEALLLRGYEDIEAFVDEASGDDLVVGYAVPWSPKNG